MQLNEIFFAGHVGKDAEDFTTQSGSRIVSFSLCQTTKGKNGGKDYSTWIRVKVFGAWAQCAAQIKKGDNVFVKGTLSISEYQNKEGQNKTSVDVFANSLSVLKKFENLEKAPSQPNEVYPDFSDVPF